MNRKGGPRTGGRSVGTPNRVSAARVEAALREGKRLPPANLLIIAEILMDMAARFQPGPRDNPNPDYDREQYAFWLDRSREALRDAAPYYSPKLHAIAVAASLSVDEKVGRVDPREQMWQTYKAMRERGEIAMKTISSTETNSNSDTPAAEPAVAVEDDDGDGVAA